MVGTSTQPTGSADPAGRLASVAAMLTDAVALLNQAMVEIKSEKGNHGDDGNASGAPHGHPEQPGGCGQVGR